MEISGEDGSKISIKPNSKTVFGRGSGFNTRDRTVSRRHVVFSLKDSGETETGPRASFEVIGKNPIWVRSGKSGKVEIFRRLEKGDVAAGDWVCFGGQSERPVWFAVNRNEFEGEEKDDNTESSELSLNLDSVDVSNIGFIILPPLLVALLVLAPADPGDLWKLVLPPKLNIILNAP
ncbi:uncharacterized protein LOC116144948 [Pistacia vera]|uniref:uncharacterized protein LOC116144948 n=1 Tax=Pistacia vera TaxID=55513 RepID=UPI0012632371|nr:uncharacterized protein LOC116144948 [Pistacia vera]